MKLSEFEFQSYLYRNHRICIDNFDEEIKLIPKHRARLTGKINQRYVCDWNKVSEAKTYQEIFDNLKELK